MMQKGLIISIDFELDWGYSNQANPLIQSEIHESLNKLIKLFDKHHIKTTWALVGKLLENEVDNSKNQPQWIKKHLITNPLTEVGSHTYNHLFSMEVSLDDFNKDVCKMNTIAAQHNLVFKSIVFPRNQFLKNNIKILKQNQYTHFRNVLEKWYLKTNKFTNENRIKRFCINFFELIPFNRDVLVKKTAGLISVSDSRFFRFFPDNLIGVILSFFYYKILKFEMKRAFCRSGLYHIWFHPHNLIKTPKGFKQLDLFLTYFNKIKVQDKKLSSYKISEIIYRS